MWLRCLSARSRCIYQRSWRLVPDVRDGLYIVFRVIVTDIGEEAHGDGEQRLFWPRVSLCDVHAVDEDLEAVGVDTEGVVGRGLAKDDAEVLAYSHDEEFHPLLTGELDALDLHVDRYSIRSRPCIPALRNPEGRRWTGSQKAG